MTRFPAVSGFLKTSSILMVARVGGTGLGFLIQLALVRLMTPSDYGVTVIALSLAAVLSIFCAFGFPSVSARFVTGYLETGDKARISGFIRSGTNHILAASMLLGCGAVGLVLVSGLVEGHYQLSLLLACLMAPVLATMRFVGALSNTARRFYLTYLPDVTLKPLLLVGGLLGVYLVALPMTTEYVLLVHLGASSLACVALWTLLRPGRQFACATVTPVSDNKVWRQAAMPMVFVTLLTSFLADIDILLLGVLLPAEDVGLFSVCLRIMLLIEFGIQTVFQMSAPDLGEAHARETPMQMKGTVRRAQHIVFCLTLTGFVGVVLLGDWVLLLFGERFVAGYPTLLILVLGQVLRSSLGPITQILTIVGAQMRSLVSYGIAVFALIAGNVLLVPGMGIEGAAIVLALSMLTGAVLQALAVSQTVGLSVVATFFSFPGSEHQESEAR